MSPKTACAWSVIPIVPMSPSTWTHSCSFVYRKFSGYMLFRSLIERSLHCHGLHRRIADEHLDIAAHLCLFHRQVTQPDVLVQCGRGRTTGDPTRRRSVQPDFVTVAR